MRVFSGKFLLLCAASVVLLEACQKYEDQPGVYDPRLTRSYCNDPAAVNYDYDFPGTPDNSVCIYPADLFAGSYAFQDSVYVDGKLVKELPLLLHVIGNGQAKFDISGFCPGGSALHFTANRALFAYADTAVGNGQILCRVQDTVSGSITRTLADTARLRIFLNVVSDTGITTHQGTAYRQ